MPFVDRGGRRVHYEVVGDGPPVLFAHSYLFSSAMWAPQVEALAARFRCISVDARGHGASDPGAGPYTMWDNADDHLAVLDALGIEQATWVGLSMGGMAGLRAALKAPARIRGLVLVDTDAGPETAWPKLKHVGLAAVAPYVGVRPLLPAVVPLMFGRTTRRRRDPIIERWSAAWAAMDVGVIVRGIRAIDAREDLAGRLSELRMPCVVLHGVEDKALPIARGRRIAEALEARIVEIPGAGHIAALEAPEAVTAAVEEFLDGL